MTEQDLKDLRNAITILADTVEWMIVRDSKRLGEKDTKRLLHEIDLAHALCEDDYKEL